MKFGTQVMAVGGLVLLVSLLAPGGDAFALGQQWRPAPGFGSAQGRAFPGVANMPSFRPYAVGRTPYDGRFARIERRPQRQYHARLSPFPTPYRGMPATAGPYQANHQPPRPAWSGWPQPFAFDRATHAWPRQAPMLVPQFAWRPMEPYWAVPQAPRFRARPGPRMVGMPPSRSGFGPHYRTWRPPQPAVGGGRQPLAHQRSASGPRRPAVFRSTGPAGRPGVAATLGGRVPGPFAHAPAHWRPDDGTRAVAWQMRQTFRPVGYGRTGADERIAARGAPSPGAPRASLPGWVTTYPDSGYGDSCSWCSGS